MDTRPNISEVEYELGITREELTPDQLSDIMIDAARWRAFIASESIRGHQLEVFENKHPNARKIFLQLQNIVTIPRLKTESLDLKRIQSTLLDYVDAMRANLRNQKKKQHVSEGHTSYPPGVVVRQPSEQRLNGEKS